MKPLKLLHNPSFSFQKKYKVSKESRNSIEKQSLPFSSLTDHFFHKKITLKNSKTKKTPKKNKKREEPSEDRLQRPKKTRPPRANLSRIPARTTRPSRRRLMHRSLCLGLFEKSSGLGIGDLFFFGLFWGFGRRRLSVFLKSRLWIFFFDLELWFWIVWDGFWDCLW